MSSPRLVAATLLVALTVPTAHAQPSADPADANWSGAFGLPGLGAGGTVGYVANDRLYFVGFLPVIQEDGSFDRALYATWDGSGWTGGAVPVNLGQFESINDLLVIGSDVYVGGDFANIDGAGTANVAHWDGTLWHPLGDGVNGPVRALATDGNGRVYVGGSFSEAGGRSARNVAAWDGGNWSVLANQGGASDGVGGGVSALAVGNSRVYVAGAFTEAGSEAATSVASWNWTTGEWSGLAGGIRHSGYSTAIGIGGIGVHGGNVYVVGDFDLAANDGGEIAVGNAALFDGTSWSAMGAGSREAGRALLVTPGGRVFASGAFDADRNGGVAEWTGTAWLPLATDQYNYQASDLVAYGNDVIAMSHPAVFTGTRGSVITNGVGRWDGTRWHGLGGGIGEYAVDTWYVNALTEHDGMLVAGGLFRSAGDQAVTNMATWNGARWTDLGAGLSAGSRIHALLSTPNGLVAGGKFRQIGGASIENVARWDGTAWHPLGDGLTDFSTFDGVRQLELVDGVVHAAGTFLMSGSVPVRGIARWTGSAWEAVGGGASEARAMTASGSDLYIGALNSSISVDFDPATQRYRKTVGNVAHWDGTEWNDLDGGVCCGSNVFNTGVRALALQGQDLIVGGDFSQAGSTPASNIARWTGSAWEPIGGGLDGVVASLHVNGTDIYAGGVFVTAGGTTVNGIARWDGSTWHPLGSGMYLFLTFPATAGVFALEPVSGGLAIGGRFSSAGNTPSNNIAMWTDYLPASGVAVIDVEVPEKVVLNQNWPNPFNPVTTISFKVPGATDVRLTVLDVLGRPVRELVREQMQAGTHDVRFDATGLPSGVYLYRIEAGSHVAIRSLVLLR